MTTDRKILVIRGGALGDFILTLPVLAALRVRFPQHRLEVLGYPAVASLAVAGGLVDGVSAVESPQFTGFFSANGSWSAEVGEWFSGFEFIVSYLYDPQGIFRSNVARCSAARFIVGPHRPDETLEVHAADLLLRPLQLLGVNESDSQPKLSLPGNPPKSRCLAVHPGSGSVRKNWPESKWAELLKLLVAESDFNILLIGGEAEGDRCARLVEGLPGERVQAAQNLPLVELAQRMRTCSAFMGHDSGITHLAAALDLPGLVLWGESVLTTWRPRSERMEILREPEGLEKLPVTKVWSGLKFFLSR